MTISTMRPLQPMKPFGLVPKDPGKNFDGHPFKNLPPEWREYLVHDVRAIIQQAHELYFEELSQLQNYFVLVASGGVASVLAFLTAVQLDQYNVIALLVAAVLFLLALVFSGAYRLMRSKMYKELSKQLNDEFNVAIRSDDTPVADVYSNHNTRNNNWSWLGIKLSKFPMLIFVILTLAFVLTTLTVFYSITKASFGTAEQTSPPKLEDVEPLKQP
jgi:hypothetical protein